MVMERPTAVSISASAIVIIFLHSVFESSSGFALRAQQFHPYPVPLFHYHINVAPPIKERPSSTLLFSNKGVIDIDIEDDTGDEPCLAGDNIVESCDTISSDVSLVESSGTQSKLSTSINIGKCICGAGSFALPHVFLNEGVLGGTIAMLICGYLAMCTMQSINHSRSMVINLENKVPKSYVELAELSLGKYAAKAVFALTLAASLGVCSTYIVFIGQTMASLSSGENNFFGGVLSNIPNDVKSWEIITAATVLPLSLIRNYSIFAFTSALGVSAVVGGMMVTLAYGVWVDPGGGIGGALMAVERLRMWPDSFENAFGGSFGTIAYLFCINFLTFPIINSMKDAKNDYDGAVSYAVAVIWIVNVIFAILCLGFYGNETQDLILGNLDSGSVYLSALKLLLCVDLVFTFPIVFSSARQILENALLADNGKIMNDNTDVDEDKATTSIRLALSRATITGGGVATCLGLSQLGGFGVVANLVGGVAQGTLAFVLPPAISIALSRRRRNAEGDHDNNFDVVELPQWLIGGFGLVVVSSVTYFTLAESFN
ncbi:hypothetical protein ACHAWU_007072 [Discostella pseudostelligera]|uniref:Amino acid transporter transmembrane domain-containing protein n=1 Tax=Discostella pseudostelligera TaxID=259834 RepID=A0ABD3N6H3_9STRA